MSATITHLRRPRAFDSREKVMDFLSEQITRSPWSYRTIAFECDLSVSTVRKIGRKETTWPRPRTFFALVDYFQIEIDLRVPNSPRSRQ